MCRYHRPLVSLSVDDTLHNATSLHQLFLCDDKWGGQSYDVIMRGLG